MLKYSGIVKLGYKNDRGIPTATYVMAFHNTSKELKENHVPLKNPKEITLTLEKGYKY